jgi:hypothetical protein
MQAVGVENALVLLLQRSPGGSLETNPAASRHPNFFLQPPPKAAASHSTHGVGKG